MLAQEIIRRVKEIQVRTGRQVADVLAGEYVSVFKGAGIEFDEVRPYVPGDDVRSIDWNVTARSGQPFVHIDTGSVRHWPRLPEDQLASIITVASHLALSGTARC